MTDFESAEILSNEEIKRLIREILGAAPDGLPKGEVLKAIDMVTEMRITSGMMKLWDDNRLSFGWNEKDQDITVQAKP